MKLQLAFYDEDDHMIYDWSRWASRITARNGRHGHESLDGDITADLWDVARLLRDRRPFRVKLNFGMWPLWDGRLEDLAAVVGGFRGAALGYWSALRDAPYTALWSWASYRSYIKVTDDDWAIMNPDKFAMDVDDRVRIAPVSGEQFATGGGSDVGAWVFRAPHNGERKIKKVTFDYDIDLPTDWKAEIVSVNELFASGNSEHLITTSGSGSATVTLGTDKDSLVFWVYNDSGSKGTYTGETGDKYAKWTNVRVWTTDSAAVYADEIVSALASFVAAINSGQMSDATALIESPGVDLTDELYEDVLPADIIDDLAGRGDDSSPPAEYEAGVGLDKMLYFRPLGSAARTWAVDAADLVLERSLAPLANSVYAVYEDGRGRLLRTAVSADADSVSAYGLTRRRAVQARTTSASQAQTERDAELERSAFPPPRASRLELRRISTKYGVEAWPWEPRPGDTVKIRNLPPELSAGNDVVTAFTIDRTEYDPMVGSFGRLRIETRSLSPTIEAYLTSLLSSRQRTAGALASRNDALAGR